MDELLLAACREASDAIAACEAEIVRFADNPEIVDPFDLCVCSIRQCRAIERVIPIAAKMPSGLAAKSAVMADYRKDMDGSMPDWRTVDLALSLAEDAAALARSFAAQADLPSP